MPDFDKEANSFTMYKDKFEMIHSFFQPSNVLKKNWTNKAQNVWKKNKKEAQKSFKIWDTLQALTFKFVAFATFYRMLGSSFIDNSSAEAFSSNFWKQYLLIF